MFALRTTRSSCLAFALTLALSACGSDDGTAPGRTAFALGSIDDALLGPAISADTELTPWTGEGDAVGPIYLTGEASASLSPDQVSSLAAAYRAGRIIALLDVSQAQLDAFTAALDIGTTHFLPSRSASEVHDIAEVFALERLPNCATFYVHATDATDPDDDTLDIVAAKYFGWLDEQAALAPHVVRAATTKSSDDSDVDLLAEATSYGGTIDVTGIKHLTVRVTPLIIGAYSFDHKLYYFLVRLNTNAQPSSGKGMKGLGIDGGFQFGTGSSAQQIDQSWITSEPESTQPGPTTYNTGVDYTVTGTVGFTVGVDSSVSASVSAGATFVDEQAVAIDNLQITNDSNLVNEGEEKGDMNFSFEWTKPPNGKVVQTVEHQLFTIDAKHMKGDAKTFVFAGGVQGETTGDNSYTDGYFTVSVGVPPNTKP